MAEQQNNVELPKETVEAPAPGTTTETAAPVEAKPVEETAAPVTDAAPAAAATTEEEKPVEAAAATEETKAEEKKEEITPIEEGQLSHKAQGLSFPKNLIPSKEYFFFGTEAVEPKTLDAYKRSEKSAETAQSNIAWASQTGKGLLFIGDKKAPTGVINLSDATEPEVDGSNKFTLNSKGNKHTFKASSTAERDNWVSQLKLKIAEAKELATSVPETETYKQTIESFKPAKKEEKPVEAAAAAPATTEEPAKTEETPAAAVEETPKAEAAATEEAAKTEEPKVEEPKRRSASRKRTSFFGFGKKEGAKSPKEEANKQLEETPAAAATTEAAPATEVAAAVAPAAEEPAKEEAAVAPVAAEEKPAEEAAAPVEKPAVTKRNSIFGSVFGKKEKKAAEPKGEAKAVEVSDEAAAPKADDVLPVVAGDAPVIPPVEATTPLEASTASPATAPVETTDVTPTTPTVEEPKKDIKEKRKSSLPFAFGKRDKSPAPAEGEKTKSSSPFSKFRDTIKGKKPAAAPATEEKTEETAAPVEEAKTEETPAEVTEAAAPATEEVKATETETKPETVAAPAAAPVAATA